ncbi:L-threonylcarbamoyladenylate synthase [Alicyclobacillus macrosporangiidus]|uniref:Threonylcarbamoyl-AMP synthase n=1 Tax=Alicyclobacillus macrosporangiidus TaxID=392015 RepID=A0A1I7HUD0_9BACL|nr:L-threonylcarbamoyladenylate synthase [Alicyclobacillus macrosporangiidus]SFU64231.1 L-threonylcarbamoyladenylate synthase [Alicyclobacillus macrosporangiidus]
MKWWRIPAEGMGQPVVAAGRAAGGASAAEGAAQGPEEAVLREALAEAAAVLRGGGLVAFPTETVYGLGANAWLDEAARRVFAAKGRPADNPLIVHIAEVGDLAGVIDRPQDVPDAARRAMDAFWPGPLTLILPANPRIAPAVRPGMDTVGVRMPAHPVARALIRAAGCPVAAPSANRSGRPSPTTAVDVAEDMRGQIDGIVDGGPCGIGVESTVARIGEEEVVIYRPGGVTPDDLARVTGLPVRVAAGPAAGEAPASPGMKYRHYAPRARVYVWWGDEDRVRVEVARFAAAHGASVGDDGDRRIALIARPGTVPPGWDPAWVWTPAVDGDPGGTPEERTSEERRPADLAGARDGYAAALSRHLYRLLRAFDRQEADVILVEGVPPEGLGLAVMNRLEKAAEGRVYRV